MLNFCKYSVLAKTIIFASADTAVYFHAAPINVLSGPPRKEGTPS